MMFVVIDSNKSQWADKEHTCIYARVKTTEGWKMLECHQYADGLAKEIWDARADFEFLPAPDEETDEAIVKRVQDSIQSMLDKKAHEKLYDDSKSLMTYIFSTNDRFRADAEKFNRWRDDCWSKPWTILDDYHDGKRPKPTFQDVMNEVPEFDWSKDYPIEQ